MNIEVLGDYKCFVRWDRCLQVLPSALRTFKTYLQCVMFNSLMRVLGLFPLIMCRKKIFFRQIKEERLGEARKK